MEQDVAAKKSSTNNGEQIKEQKWKIATIVVSIVAVCSFGFGIYESAELTDRTKQLNEYKNQAAGLRDQVAELRGQLMFATEDSDNGCKIEDGYLYIEEWGYKISIPNSATGESNENSIQRCEYLGENDIEQPADGALQIFSFNYKSSNQPSVDYSIERQKGSVDWSKNKSSNWTPIELNDDWEYRLYYSLPDESATEKTIEIFTSKDNYGEI